MLVLCNEQVLEDVKLDIEDNCVSVLDVIDDVYEGLVNLIGYFFILDSVDEEPLVDVESILADHALLESHAVIIVDL